MCDCATDSPCVHTFSFQAEGNELYAQGKYVKAMTKYTEVGRRVLHELGASISIVSRHGAKDGHLSGVKSLSPPNHGLMQAVAIFRYWNREMIGRDQNLVCYVDDRKCEAGDDKQKAQKFICSVLLNAAACLIKLRTPASPREVVWTCTEVLELDDSCVKAYYRRAMAYVNMDSSTTLELAVKDLTKAAQLAPGEKVGAALNFCFAPLAGYVFGVWCLVSDAYNQ